MLSAHSASTSLSETGLNSFITYIEKHFGKHAHLETAKRVIETVAYLSNDIKSENSQIKKKLAELSKDKTALDKQLFRHPTNHLSVHLNNYTSFEDAHYQITELTSELESVFQDMLSIPDRKTRDAVIDAFLLNINDSATGCMEARLRGALLFYGKYKSAGCVLNINALMAQFAEKFKDQYSIQDILSFFSDAVQLHLPIQNLNGQIEPLTWKIVKGYFKEIMYHEMIDADWEKFIFEVHPASINSEGKWVVYSFTSEVQAKNYLSYIKSVLPQYHNELARAEVESSNGEYQFSLRNYQYNKLNDLLLIRDTKKYKEEVIDQAPIAEPVQQTLATVFSNAFLSMNADAYKCYWFCFSSKEQANQALNVLKETFPFFKMDKISIIEYEHPERKYCFLLTEENWKVLRNGLREKAKRELPRNDYLIKSLRGDENNFVRKFFSAVIAPFKKMKFRIGNKLPYTVTGKGIFRRPQFPADKNSPLPYKKPQFTRAQKEGYSNFQSTTLGWPDYSPGVFGFDKRKAKLVGILVDIKDALLSERLYIYDGGTVQRPYDYDNFAEAKDYAEQKQGKVIFSSDQVDEFKTAILKNPTNYNEALARLRWNLDGTSKIIIASDTLEARMLAQDYARILKNHLLANKLCDSSYEPKIIYYLPDQPELHFKEYTPDEQILDQLNCRFIYSQPTLRSTYYGNSDYEFLFALSAKEIEAVFKESYLNINVIVSMLNKGYIHIVRSLLEKHNKADTNELGILLKKSLSECNSFLPNILYHCLNTDHEEIANIVFEVLSSQTPLHITEFDQKKLLALVAEKGLANWVDKLLDGLKLNVDLVNADNRSALQTAAYYGHLETVEKLLARPNIQVNGAFLDINGHTPLHLAASFGHTEIVERLLQHPKVKTFIEDSRGMTALHLAASKGHSKTVKCLQAHQDNINHSNLNLETALHLAVRNGHVDTVDRLLLHPEIDLSFKNRGGWTPLDLAICNGQTVIAKRLLNHLINSKKVFSTDGLLHLAAQSGQLEIVVYLHERVKMNVDLQNLHGKTPLHVAVEAGHPHVVEYLLSKAKAKINIKDNNQNTALHLAVLSGNLITLEHLLKTPEIEVNHKNDLDTSLRMAINNKKVEIVRRLLACPTLDVDEDGSLVIRLTNEKNDHDIIERLLLTHKIRSKNLGKEEISIILNMAINNNKSSTLDRLLNQPLMFEKNIPIHDFATRVAEHDLVDFVKILLSHPKLSQEFKTQCANIFLPIAMEKKKYNIIDALFKSTMIDFTHPLHREAFSLLCTKGYKTNLNDYLIEKYLPQYIERREKQGDYKHWYGRLFGVHKNKKIAAAKALQQYKSKSVDFAQHEKALSEGELGELYELFLMSVDGGIKVNTVEDNQRLFLLPKRNISVI